MTSKQAVLMENHNDALLWWRKTEQKNRILVHIDSHFDFAWITDKDPQEILNAKTLSDFKASAKENLFWNLSNKKKDELTHIGNYIYPAIKENIVREFYWVVPDSLFFSKKRLRHFKKEIDDIIKSNPEEKGGLTLQGNYLTSKLCNIQLTICRLKDLPEFNEDVLLDIDVDYFIAQEKAWLYPDAFIQILREKKLKSAITTIAYSVEGGFTPIEYKFFGDYLNYLFNTQKDGHFEKAVSLMIKAIDCKKNKAYKDALQFLKDADACYPDYAPICFHLSDVYYEMDFEKEAYDYYQNAVSKDSSYKTVYNNRGYLFESKNKLKEGEDEYKKMLELDPQNPDFLIKLGNIHKIRKRWGEALLNYNNALKLNPNKEEALQNIGYIQLSNKNLDNGIENLKKALSLKPDNPFTHSYLGLAYMRKRDYNEAMRETRRAINTGLSALPALRWRLVFIYFKKGLYDRMFNELKAAFITSYFALFWRIKWRLSRY